MNIFQLFGEIAIDNSKANEQIDKTAKGAKKLASTMKSAFATAGKAAVKAGKVIAAGVAAGTAAMGKLVKSALDGYADYEQLEGGVKKLFGKDAQKLVMEYAKNAYKTAGLSANEYMDTVTSFSGSLISSLGKDTVAAAKYADIAITDMADNANTFGTSMEDIQNAYKGFSKQNYTMLDNLKLGYGGTQKEMERLLADASEISKEKYNISNFSDIIEAIHVIQDNQGIAGTTAAEAEKTISGSVNAAKAAWQNLLSGLADGNQDIDQLVNNLADSVMKAVNQIVPRLQTMAPRLVQAVQTLVSTLAPQLPGIINSVLPAMIEAATTLITGLADVLPDVMGIIIDQLPTIFNQIGGAIQKLFPSIVKTFKNLIGKIDFKGLGQAIGSGLRSIVTNLPQILSDIGNAIKWAWENIAYPLIQGIFKGIFGIDLPDWDKVAESISGWWEDVKTAVGGALEIAFKAVESAVSTAKATVERWWGKVKAAAWNVMKIMFRLDDAKLRDAVDKIKGFWKDVVAEIGNTLALMWHLLNPINIARQVKDAWTRATSGLNLSVCWSMIQKTASEIGDPNSDTRQQLGEMFAPENRETTKKRLYVGLGALWDNLIHPNAKGAVFSKPTIFDTRAGYQMVGEAGAEAVAPIGVLQGYVKSAVAEAMGSGMERKLDQMLTVLGEGFSGMHQPIILDTGVLVGSTAGKMDKRLGRMAARKGRNA